MTQAGVLNSSKIDFHHELTKGFAARFVRSKARRLVGHAGLRSHDRDDLQQELLTAVWQAAATFDPAVGDWESFVATIVERHAGQILIRRNADKRCLGQAVESLDVLVTDGEGFEVPLATQIRRDHQASITGNHTLEGQQQAELRLDLEELLEPLSDDERNLLVELAEASQLAVARKRGVSRRAIRDLLEQVRTRIANSDEVSEIPEKRPPE